MYLIVPPTRCDCHVSQRLTLLVAMQALACPMHMYRTLALLRPLRCYVPPLQREVTAKGQFLLPYTPPPPPPTPPHPRLCGLQFVHVSRVDKRV